jgi:hypothetical protein
LPAGTIASGDAGAAVVCVSSELEEILKISERIAVTAGGQFAGEVADARAVFKANCDKCAAACSAKAEIFRVSIRFSGKAARPLLLR